MSQNSKNIGDQEIDLSLISSKIGSFFENLSTRIFRGILFLQRNLLVIGILLVLGVSLGFYLDKSKRTYESQIIVSPNFGSVDYLYSKINLLNTKIEEGDIRFLKNVVGISNPREISKIEIKPINDVYDFIEQKVQNLEENQNSNLNFEMIKLMAEDGDINKILENSITSKHYANHTIKVTANNKISFEKVINPILKYLNTSEYFHRLNLQAVENIKNKISQNDSMILQINNLLGDYNGPDQTGKSKKSVFLNEDIQFQLNDLIRTKDYLIREKEDYYLKLIKEDKIVKDNEIILNIRKHQMVGGKYKLILPVLFIIAFIFAGAFRSYYRRQLAKLSA